jgi:hypothetical protein
MHPATEEGGSLKVRMEAWHGQPTRTVVAVATSTLTKCAFSWKSAWPRSSTPLAFLSSGESGYQNMG